MNDRRLSSAVHSSFIIHHFPVLAEVCLVFAVFFIQGATPVPDVNEPYYLGKAIHFWNPDFARGDFFLASKDSHEVFYYTFGWLSLWCNPPALAWVGRLLTWVLLAWAWQRLSFALIPKRWCSILSAALLVCLIQRCHMAGEWLIGGVEAKGFAFVLVFLGLEALVRGRWNRVWLLLGAASAFHVLVGGWSVVAAGFCWLISRFGKGTVPFSPCENRDSPHKAPLRVLRSMWPAVLGGFLLSLPGLVPALMLNWGTDAEIVRLANQIYVYRRLYHHLDPLQIPGQFILRFACLCALWLVMCRLAKSQESWRRLRGFVGGTVLLAVAGGLIGLLQLYNAPVAAGWLRFYWFRLADVAVPLGVALEGTRLAVGLVKRPPGDWPDFRSAKMGLSPSGYPSAVRKSALATAILVAGVHLGGHLVRLPFPAVPPAFKVSRWGSDYDNWWRACHWVAHSGEVPPDALFITPGQAQTFKWYTARGEVANWKEIPQDAVAIVAWWRRIDQLYLAGRSYPKDESLADLGAERLKELGEAYQADYVLTVATDPLLDLVVVYENRSFVVYRLPEQYR